MKNCLYFDCEYCTGLLCSEEDDSNSISVVITPDSDNQKLEVKVDSKTTTFDLTAGEKNCVPIPDELWNLGGETLFRFCKDSQSCEWYTITFPEDISTQVMLCEDGERRYKVCGPESNEDMSQYELAIITYKNMVAYTIEKNDKKIATLGYTTKDKDTVAVFNVTIVLTAFDIPDTAELKFRLLINKQYDDFFIPIQTIRNGSNIVTITYPVQDIAANSANKLYLYASVNEGSVHIEQQALRAMIFAQGLAKNNEWDGMIEIEEECSIVTFGTPLSLVAMGEDIVANANLPTGSNIAETLEGIALGESIISTNIVDTISIEQEGTS